MDRLGAGCFKYDPRRKSQPSMSDGLQPKSDGLQPNRKGLQPESDGLHPRAMASTLEAMASNQTAMASNLIGMASNLRALASNLNSNELMFVGWQKVLSFAWNFPQSRRCLCFDLASFVLYGRWHLENPYVIALCHTFLQHVFFHFVYFVY